MIFVCISSELFWAFQTTRPSSSPRTTSSSSCSGTPRTATSSKRSESQIRCNIISSIYFEINFTLCTIFCDILKVILVQFLQGQGYWQKYYSINTGETIWCSGCDNPRVYRMYWGSEVEMMTHRAMESKSGAPLVWKPEMYNSVLI